jgi:outer membrane lipoprotein SlyB
METQNKSNRIHPLVAAAAVAVLLACLIGIAAMTGLLPNSGAVAGKQSVAELNAAAEQKAADAKHAAAKKSTQSARTEPARAICHECGRVESVQAIQTAAKPSGVGVVGGAVVGGLLGNQVGGGTGRTLATVAGAVGGGYAGNEIEKRTRTATTWQVRVRMEDGNMRTFPYNNQPSWGAGDRVRVVDGYLKAR